MTPDQEVEDLDARLRKAKDDISAWCMRMAWPGRAPTPPYKAWEERTYCIARLRELGHKRFTRF